MTIWVVGGTGDSAELIDAISEVTSDLVVTVATSEAKHLYNSRCSVIVGSIDGGSMAQFCRDYSITAIVDASHPFATEVSQNAIAVSKALNLPYLRYERAVIDSPDSSLDLSLIHI